MSHELFEKNLQSLRLRYPRLADLNSQPPIDVKPSSPPVPSSWHTNLKIDKGSHIVIFGLGDGSLIAELWEKYDPRNLVVIERNVNTLSNAMARHDLTNILDHPHIYLSIADNLKSLEYDLEYVKTSLAAHGFSLLHNPQNSSDSNEYYKQIQHGLKQLIEHESFNLRARLQRGPLVQRNLIANFSHALSAHSLDDVKNLFAQQPAIIVAAGPSLDKNVEQLQEVNNSAVIICVDTALNTLQHYGIKPHMVVTTDPSPENAHHFDGLQLEPETVFAFTPDCYFSLPQQFSKHPHHICIYDDSSRLTYWLRKHLGLHTFIERPQHVAETAIRLALVMGSDPIIFTGLDLALSPEAHKTHAQHSARAGHVASLKKNAAEIKNPDGELTTLNLVEVMGINGSMVPTYYSFKQYLDRLERLMADHPIQWIDATQGGAFKKGAQVKALNDVLSLIPSHSLHVHNRFQNLHTTGLNHTEGINEIQKAVGRLQSFNVKLQLALEGSINTETLEQLWHTFLADETLRAFYDHAVFQYQLEPPLSSMPAEEHHAFLLQKLAEARQVMQLFLPFWLDTLNRITK